MEKKFIKRKMLIGVIISLSCTAMIGCTSSKNELNITSINKAEKVVKSEYVSRIKRLVENTLNNDVVILKDEVTTEKEDKYDQKYLESKIFEENFYGGDRDRYKDFTEGLSTFRTEDDEINKLHDKLIEVSTDIYNMYNETIELGIEKEALSNKDVKSITDTDEKRVDEVFERMDTLEDMIENQQEHVGNIGDEIFNTLGVEY